MKSRSRFSFSVLVYFLGLSVLGLCLLPFFPVKERPMKRMQVVSVSFSMNGQSPHVVEKKVTSVLEGSLAEIDGVSRISSVSHSDGGRVTLVLDDKADMDAVRFEVSQNIRNLWQKMPREAGYPSVAAQYSDAKSAEPFMVYALAFSGAPEEVEKYVERFVRPQLARIKGVEKVEVSGLGRRGIVVEYSPEILETCGLTADDIRRAVSADKGGRFIEFSRTNANGGKSNVRVCVSGSVPEAGEQKETLVRNSSGQLFPLKKLAEVKEAEMETPGRFRINGHTAVTLALYADAGANQILLSSKVRETVGMLSASKPEGCSISLLSDASQDVKGEIADVASRSFAAFAILLLFVFATNRNRRYLLVITLALAANLAVAFVFYKIFNVEVQVYSIAGIAVSFGMIIDNALVMTDHLVCRGKLDIFTAILASTLTTVFALSAIFFLDGRMRLNLVDFAVIMIVNLAVSLAVALFLVPALVGWLGLKRHGNVPFGRMRAVCRADAIYVRFINVVSRHRRIMVAVAVLAFGVPLFLLPEHVDGDGFAAKAYNSTVGSPAYSAVRKYSDPLLGGTLRMFCERPLDGGERHFFEQDDSKIVINAFLPQGGTVSEMDTVMRRMENVLRSQSGIRMFRTDFDSRRGGIMCSFTEEAVENGTPRRVADVVAHAAVNIGNANWEVIGAGRGFSNLVEKPGRSFRILLSGYNYDRLTAYAGLLADSLARHPRVSGIRIVPPENGSGGYEEFALRVRDRQLAAYGYSPAGAFSSVTHRIPYRSASYGAEGGVVVKPADGSVPDYWGVSNSYVNMGKGLAKVSRFSEMSLDKVPMDICRENQSYKLVLEYDYMGDISLAGDVRKAEVENFNRMLPKGYYAEETGYDGAEDGGSFPYKALALVVMAVYLICAVLFNSFRLPLIVVSVIPLSFIGIFVSFRILSIPLNQGAVGAFILLGGLTCNSVIYILSDYKAYCRKGLAGMAAYIKAFNGKIVPIIMTVLSTALGFLPFMVGCSRDSFWYSLSVGTVAGLAVSMIGLVVYTPLFISHKDSGSRIKNV